MTADPFASLPLFATDEGLAVAIVGKTRAEKWRKERLPTIASKPGFPAIDDFHRGRAVPLVRLFYENYMSITSRVMSKSESKERPDTWNSKSRARKRPSDRPKL